MGVIISKKIDVTFSQDEYSALLEMGVEDLRNPSDQLRHILRLEIDRRSQRDDDEALKNEKDLEVQLKK